MVAHTCAPVVRVLGTRSHPSLYIGPSWNFSSNKLPTPGDILFPHHCHPSAGDFIFICLTPSVMYRGNYSMEYKVPEWPFPIKVPHSLSMNPPHIDSMLLPCAFFLFFYLWCCANKQHQVALHYHMCTHIHIRIRAFSLTHKHARAHTHTHTHTHT